MQISINMLYSNQQFTPVQLTSKQEIKRDKYKCKERAARLKVKISPKNETRKMDHVLN